MSIRAFVLGVHTRQVRPQSFGKAGLAAYVTGYLRFRLDFGFFLLFSFRVNWINVWGFSMEITFGGGGLLNIFLLGRCSRWEVAVCRSCKELINL